MKNTNINSLVLTSADRKVLLEGLEEAVYKKLLAKAEKDGVEFSGYLHMGPAMKAVINDLMSNYL